MDADRVIDLGKPGDVDLDRFRYVARQALDLDGVKVDQQVRVAPLHRRRLADDGDRDLDLQFLFEVDPEEVDVLRALEAGMGLDFLDQDLLGTAAVELEVDQVGPAGLGVDTAELGRVEADRLRLGAVAVDDPGDDALRPQPADVAAVDGALGCREFEVHFGRPWLPPNRWRRRLIISKSASPSGTPRNPLQGAGFYSIVMVVGGPPRLLAVVAAGLVAISAALVAEANAEASSSLTQVAAARQQLTLDLLGASAAGFSDQDLGPILDSMQTLSDQPAPAGLSDRAAFYRSQAAAFESLRGSLGALEVHQLDLLRSAATTRLADLSDELARTIAELESGLLDHTTTVNQPGYAPIEAQVSSIQTGLAIGYGPADFRRVFEALGAPIDQAQQLRAARAADLAAVQAEASRLVTSAGGSLDAVRQVGLGALYYGRNYATAVAYLRLEPGRQYDLLESDATRLQGTDIQDVAEAAALEERHRDLLHAALIAGFPAKGIFVSIQDEELWAYDHGQLFVDTLVTTGMPQLPTDTGLMRINRKESPVHFVSPFPKGSPYDYGTIDARYALWFQPSGEAIHDSWWRSWYGPGSNLNGRGSIGVPYGPIDRLYPWGDVGTPVLVIPGDGSPLASQLALKTYDDPAWGSAPPD